MTEGHHRSPHPDDVHLFAPSRVPTLRLAVEEVCWMLGRAYPMSLAVRAAGDRHQLEQRARLAVTRAAAAPAEVADRASRRVALDALGGSTLEVDAFNVIISLEMALGGAPLFVCADGPLRDLAGMRGSYRLAVETPVAIDLLGAALARCAVARCVLWIDAPVSNSGRLRALLAERAATWGLATQIEMVGDADRAMRGCALAASADAMVIDGASRWCNLAREVIERDVPTAWRIALAG